MAIEHTIYASPGLPVDGARRLLGIDGNGDLTLNGGGAGPLEVTPTGSSTPRTLADWMAGMTGLGAGSAAAPSVAFEATPTTGLFQPSDSPGYLGIASSGEQVAVFGYRLLNSNQKNARLRMGTGQTIGANTTNDYYLGTIDLGTVNQSGNSNIIGLNIGIIGVTATDQVQKKRPQYNVELDMFQITAGAGEVTYDKVGNTRVRFPVAQTNVTITDAVGITFLLGNTLVTGAVTNYKGILFPAMTGSGGTNFWGLFFEGQPNKGMIGTADDVDLLITAGVAGGTNADIILRTEELTGSAIQLIGSTISMKTGTSTRKEILRLGSVGSADNYVRIDANNNPLIYSQGPLTDVALTFSTKGAGAMSFFTHSGGTRQFNITARASAVNYVDVTGGLTGNPADIRAQGSDTNVTLALIPKGTGTVRITSLPTSASGLSTGDLWNNGGVVNVA